MGGFTPAEGLFTAECAQFGSVSASGRWSVVIPVFRSGAPALEARVRLVRSKSPSFIQKQFQRSSKNQNCLWFHLIIFFFLSLSLSRRPILRGTTGRCYLQRAGGQSGEGGNIFDPTTESRRDRWQNPPPPEGAGHRKQVFYSKVVCPASRGQFAPFKQSLRGLFFFPFLSPRLRLCYETCESTRTEQTWAVCHGTLSFGGNQRAYLLKETFQ